MKCSPNVYKILNSFLFFFMLIFMLLWCCFCGLQLCVCVSHFWRCPQSLHCLLWCFVNGVCISYSACRTWFISDRLFNNIKVELQIGQSQWPFTLAFRQYLEVLDLVSEKIFFIELFIKLQLNYIKIYFIFGLCNFQYHYNVN